MALPASGTIRLSQVQTEFGGATPPQNLRAYLKGAGYVNTGDTAPNVPSSGTIKLRDFLGAAKVFLSVSCSPTAADGVGTGSGVQTVTTDPAVVPTATGGASPYTYSWSLVSGTSLTMGGTSTSRTWSRSLAVNTTASATYRVTATDANGSTGTADVTVSLSNPA